MDDSNIVRLSQNSTKRKIVITAVTIENRQDRVRRTESERRLENNGKGTLQLHVGNCQNTYR
jgi:hypothetical protein